MLSRLARTGKLLPAPLTPFRKVSVPPPSAPRSPPALGELDLLSVGPTFPPWGQYLGRTRAGESPIPPTQGPHYGHHICRKEQPGQAAHVSGATRQVSPPAAPGHWASAGPQQLHDPFPTDKVVPAPALFTLPGGVCGVPASLGVREFAERSAEGAM